MSINFRHNPPLRSGELTTKEVDAFPIWEVFTQRKESDVHIHSGSLSAPDISFAQQFGREHYGQDQVCINMWIGLREDFKSTGGEEETYEIFIQWGAGDRHVHVGSVNATNGEEAKKIGLSEFAQAKECFTIWSIPHSKLIIIDSESDMIWRTTDQAYRLAKGYSKIVRQKWEAIREGKDVDEYQKGDHKETF